jgi:hypothetical protein
MCLDAHEFAFRHRRVGARAGRIVAHVIGDGGGPARQQKNAVGEIDRFFEIVRDQVSTKMRWSWSRMNSVIS